MSKTEKKASGLSLPKSKFAMDLAGGAVESTMKAAGATTGKLYNVPVGSIKMIPGFNPRVQSADYIAHRDMLVESMTERGFDPTRPLTGFVAKEGDANVIYVTDGHTRLDAISVVNAEEETISSVPVLVQPKETSLVDLTVQLHTSNNGRPLTPFELGVVVKRLLNEEDASKTEIARRLSVTPRYIDDVLLLASADKKVKQHVASGVISSTFAIDLLRKDADSAAEKIEAALAKGGGTKKKVTKKDVGPKMQKVKADVSFAAGDDMKEIVKAAAKAIRAAVTSSEQADGDETILVADTGGSVTLVIEIPVAEKAPAKAKTKTKATPAPKKAAKASDEPESKPASTKKASAKPKKGKKKAAPGGELGIPGAVAAVMAAADDDEPARIPPVVKSDANIPDEEVDI